MYSNLGDIWTLELSDENNNVLSSQRMFRGRPNSIRKLTNARMKQVMNDWGIKNTADLTPAAWEESGRRTLKWLLANHEPTGAAAKAKALRIWKVDYSIEDGQPSSKRHMIIEYPMPAKQAPAPKEAAKPAPDPSPNPNPNPNPAESSPAPSPSPAEASGK